jgi:hypothetical protein
LIENKDNEYSQALIKKGFDLFARHQILQFENAKSLPIHFIGSIAHFSEDIIKDCMKPYNLELGNIIRRPIDGLIEYYKQHKL